MQLALDWRPWCGVDRLVRVKNLQVYPNSPSYPNHQPRASPPPCSPKALECGKAVTREPEEGRPRGVVCCAALGEGGLRGAGWAKAYPVLGEEPCRDTAYVLATAGPAWCSRCGPPGWEGKEGQVEETRE